MRTGPCPVENYQALGGERFQNFVGLEPVNVGVLGIQLGSGYRTSSKPAIAADHGEAPH